MVGHEVVWDSTVDDVIELLARENWIERIRESKCLLVRMVSDDLQLAPCSRPRRPELLPRPLSSSRAYHERS